MKKENQRQDHIKGHKNGKNNGVTIILTGMDVATLVDGVLVTVACRFLNFDHNEHDRQLVVSSLGDR
jgi:hypothetical protein